MKKTAWLLALAMAAPQVAYAADLGSSAPAPVSVPPPQPLASGFDLGFGAKLMSDYNFRGITQSNHGPSAGAYVEPRYGWFYAGVAAWAVKLPTSPTAEVDLYGGIRPTWGPLSADLGAIYYWYPHEDQHAAVPGAKFPPFPNGNTTLKDTDFFELYAKPSWTINDWATVGSNLYWSPSFAHTGATGTYLSGTLKFTLPDLLKVKDLGWYTSVEFGHYFLGRTNAAAGRIDLPDYNFWNVGLAFTYKAFTLDLRYNATDLSKKRCNIITGDPGARIGPGGAPRSSWCGTAFIATLSIDTSLAALK
jgi:uncharacterized protein (TIGR02001 family)